MAQHHPSIARRRLEKAASKLRHIERQVLVLAARDGLSNVAIAARLEIAPEAAEALLASALARLARALERPARPWWKLW